MKIKVKIEIKADGSKINMFTARNCHSKQKKGKLICSWPGTAIQSRKRKISMFIAGNCRSKQKKEN